MSSSSTTMSTGMGQPPSMVALIVGLVVGVGSGGAVLIVICVLLGLCLCIKYCKYNFFVIDIRNMIILYYSMYGMV